MINNYAKRVFSKYEKQKEDNLLSVNLLNPTPASLREECIHVYLDRNKPSEDLAIRAFFGSLNLDKDYQLKMENIDIDKFRPLVNFLNGKTTKPSKKNIELLEWLINDNESIDKPSYETEELFEKVKTDVVINNSKTFNSENEIKEYKNIGFLNKKFRKTIVTFLVVICVIIGFYFIYQRNKPKYMYWENNHYEPLEHNNKVINLPIIALDNFKITQLKKITRPDTITYDDLGKIWYVKVNKDSVEFYTSKGEYPLDTTKILKPITTYIIDKYVLKMQ